MKKIYKRVLIIIIISIIAIVALLLIKAKISVAYISYSFSIKGESDSGSRDRYVLYSNIDGTYNYKIMKSVVTESGRTKETLEEKGKIKSKEDLIKIDSEIKSRVKNQKEEGSFGFILEESLSTKYVFIHINRVEEEFTTIEKFADKLFN